MSTLGEENRGADETESHRDVEEALRSALDAASPVPVTTLGAIVDHSDYSRSTVNKRLRDDLSGSNISQTERCCSAELKGTTYYWIEDVGRSGSQPAVFGGLSLLLARPRASLAFGLPTIAAALGGLHVLQWTLMGPVVGLMIMAVGLWFIADNSADWLMLWLTGSALLSGFVWIYVRVVETAITGATPGIDYTLWAFTAFTLAAASVAFTRFADRSRSTATREVRA